MSETFELREDDLLLRLIRRSLRTESAAEVKGDLNGVPFFVIVAAGANAGLVERYARAGGLRLTPDC